MTKNDSDQMGIIHHPLSGEIQDPRCGLVDKITVMGDLYSAWYVR